MTRASRDAYESIQMQELRARPSSGAGCSQLAGQPSGAIVTLQPRSEASAAAHLARLGVCDSGRWELVADSRGEADVADELLRLQVVRRPTRSGELSAAAHDEENGVGRLPLFLWEVQARERE